MSLDEKPEISKPEKKKKKRCVVCNKKLGLMEYSCRCGQLFCIKHQLPEEHNCTFDYQKMGKDLLDKKNPQVVGNKVIKI